MGARQSKRSVDITTTPKKEGIPAEGGVGDAAAPGDGKLERIEEADTKPTTNGIAPHTDTAEDKEKDKDEATEKDKEQVVSLLIFIFLSSIFLLNQDIDLGESTIFFYYAVNVLIYLCNVCEINNSNCFY